MFFWGHVQPLPTSPHLQPHRPRCGPRLLRRHVRPAALSHRAPVEPERPGHSRTPADRGGRRSAQLADGRHAARGHPLGRPGGQEGPPLHPLRQHCTLFRRQSGQRLRGFHPDLRSMPLLCRSGPCGRTRRGGNPGGGDPAQGSAGLRHGSGGSGGGLRHRDGRPRRALSELAGCLSGGWRPRRGAALPAGGSSGKPDLLQHPGNDRGPGGFPQPLYRLEPLWPLCPLHPHRVAHVVHRGDSDHLHA